MKKKILLIFLIVVVLLTGVFYYVNKAILPAKLKAIAADKIQELTGRKASIGDVQFTLAKGFIIKDLIIFAADPAQPHLLDVKSISLQILYTSFLKDKKIIIPSVTIERPVINVIRGKDNRFNFSDILEKQLTLKPDNQPSFSVIVLNVTLMNAKVDLTDQAPPTEVKEILDPLNIKIRLGLPQNVKYILDAAISQNNNPATLFLEGDYELISKKATAHLKLASFPISDYLPIYYTSPLFELKRGSLKDLTADIVYKENTIEVKGKLQLADIDVLLSTKESLSGSPSAQFTAKVDLASPSDVIYDALIDLNGTSISGLPFINEITELAGKLRVNPNSASTDSLSLNALSSQFTVSGSVNDFQKPTADLKIISDDINLDSITPLVEPFLKDQKIKASGHASLALSLKGALPPDEKTQYNLLSTLRDVNIKVQDPFIDLTNISGRVGYDSKQIVLENLLVTALGSQLKIGGVISDLQNPYLDIAVSSARIDLSKALSFIPPDILAQSKITKLTGMSSVVASFKGLGQKPLSGQYAIGAVVQESTISIKDLPGDLSAISGKITVKPDNIQWEELQGTFQGKTYLLNGKLTNFDEPLIDTNMSSSEYDLTGKVKIFKDKVNILSLKGKYLDLPFDAKGNIFLAQGKDPEFSIRAQAAFDIKSLPRYLPQFKEQFEELKPSGVFKVDTTISGAGQDWHFWHMETKATSPDVVMSGYHMKDIVLDLSQLIPSATQLNITANVYEGALKTTLTANLTEKNMPFKLVTTLDKTNIAVLKNDTVFKDQDVSGFLSLNFTGDGFLDDFKKIEGQGSVLINNGKLWQLNLFKGLKKFLLIPEFESIVFTEAKGDFIVKEEKLSTSSFELLSDSLAVMCAGWVDFATNLNFDVALKFSEESIASSESLKKALTSFLTQGEDYLAIKISGTLKEPKYSYSKSAIINKAKDLIIEGLQSIFQ